VEARSDRSTPIELRSSFIDGMNSMIRSSTGMSPRYQNIRVYHPHQICP
jgi:hypothetical protein